MTNPLTAEFPEIARITAHEIVPVVVIDDANQADVLGEALVRGGLPVAEVTFRTPAAPAAIATLAGRGDLLVGAGTVLSTAQVEQAVEAGAKFIVSPGFDADVVRCCQEIGVPCLPGAVTASEVIQALKLGLSTIKFFPAEAVGGTKTIQALASAFRQMKFLPTGGINAKNACDYLNLDCVAAIGGSWMVPAKLINAGALAQLTELISSAVSTVNQ